ncbi:cysteine--tRNA ligase [Paenibacillus sp. J5C_2022]|uniref:cysteine--tRNA ligase n=1 Tax=Paenibacillus sp. J5C2022 TaxID=2977129 RepID=UPI0021D3AC6A|nr:cysteine--tRNA ligase [Paenibacillus sp. J5C2022]MCU6711640.1 cysteine--tRNA ligase [Paenibacillus sp. J5C2022]
MSIKIYNSMSRSKEEFRPQQPGKASIYVCGPTVYDYIHIGNARPAIFFDVVRRYMEYAGYEVQYVVNFTDVDDKLIRRAAEIGSTVPDVSARFIDAFHSDTAALGVREASLNPRVTEHLPEIIDFISGLVAGGHAYASEGDVYFRTSSFKDYGKLSHQNIEELQFGIRVEVDDRKESAGDFVLWKGAKPGEISWDSPWGPGRPGWHIECSAMARKYLGDTIDIHGGGTDLQFPHHECEVAQSESLTGKPLANYWMHNGYINIDNEKMSKSLGNGITVHELVKRVKPEAIRYFMLAAHYRGPLNFSDDAIAQAENSVERINNFAGNLKHRLAAADLAEALEDGQHEELQEKVAGIERLFQAKMNDDFNTPDAITALFELVMAGNQYMQGKSVDARGLSLLQDALRCMDDVLGLLYAQEGDELLDEEIDRLIEERTEARMAKNWARADEIRDLLAERNIVLEDTPQGIRWRRK